MVVAVVAQPRAGLVPVAGGKLNVEDVDYAVLVGIAGRIVGCARCARTGLRCGRAGCGREIIRMTTNTSTDSLDFIAYLFRSGFEQTVSTCVKRKAGVVCTSAGLVGCGRCDSTADSLTPRSSRPSCFQCHADHRRTLGDDHALDSASLQRSHRTIDGGSQARAGGDGALARRNLHLHRPAVDDRDILARLGRTLARHQTTPGFGGPVLFFGDKLGPPCDDADDGPRVRRGRLWPG